MSRNKSHKTISPRPRRVLRVISCLFVLLATAALLSWVFSNSILRTAARLWIIETEPFEQVDAIIVPGGGLATRPFGAAELFHSGRSDRLVVFDVKKSPDQEIGVTPTSKELTLKVLEELKVPRSAITVIGNSVASTWDEVEATLEWSIENDIRSVAVMTEVFSSRRVRWAFERGFAAEDIKLHIISLNALDYTADDWWHEENGVIQFQNEVIKYFYYLLRY